MYTSSSIPGIPIPGIRVSAGTVYYYYTSTGTQVRYSIKLRKKDAKMAKTISRILANILYIYCSLRTFFYVVELRYSVRVVTTVPRYCIIKNTTTAVYSTGSILYIFFSCQLGTTALKAASIKTVLTAVCTYYDDVLLYVQRTKSYKVVRRSMFSSRPGRFINVSSRTLRRDLFLKNILEGKEDTVTSSTTRIIYPTSTVNHNNREWQEFFTQVCGILTGHVCVPVTVKASQLSGAGQGVYAVADIPSGTAVTLYAGRYYPPPPLWTIAASNGEPVIGFQSDILPSRDYLMHCSGHGGMLDGYNCPINPKAVAQLVNHPSPPNRPNVRSLPFKWVDALECLSVVQRNEQEQETLQQQQQQQDPAANNITSTCGTDRRALDMAEMHKEIHSINQMGSGLWYVDPLTDEAVLLSPECPAPLVGCVFVTTADIRAGEELFYDYKLRKGPNVPPWYVPVD